LFKKQLEDQNYIPSKFKPGIGEALSDYYSDIESISQQHSDTGGIIQVKKKSRTTNDESKQSKSSVNHIIVPHAQDQFSDINSHDISDHETSAN
jgi:hypothetical protein